MCTHTQQWTHTHTTWTHTHREHTHTPWTHTHTHTVNTHTHTVNTHTHTHREHTHSSEHTHTQQWTHTHTPWTHTQQWTNTRSTRGQLGVRCLAQGSHLSRGIEGGRERWLFTTKSKWLENWDCLGFWGIKEGVHFYHCRVVVSTHCKDTFICKWRYFASNISFKIKILSS